MKIENLNEVEVKNLPKLTQTQLLYFLMMKPMSGLLYIEGKPGIAKSAILRSIAKKLDYNFLDIRLSMIDETDVGLFPTILETKEGKFLYHVVPAWANEANKRKTIICFEELNRAPLPVRNAALQLFLEREIGTEFKFNENVLMCATGNLGEEDSTDVEEFDSALNGRLIHYKHELTLNEWIEDFAKDHIHSSIIEFLKIHPDKFYAKKNNNTKAYASPRSWTFLSDFIINNWGKDAKIDKFFDVIKHVGISYIGNSFTQYMEYLESNMSLTIYDILDRYSDVKALLKTKYKKDKINELVFTLNENIDVTKLSRIQYDNLLKFLSTVDIEERCSYILKLTDKTHEKDIFEGSVVYEILRYFKKDVDILKQENRKNFQGNLDV